jgi:hypothetical protein
MNILKKFKDSYKSFYYRTQYKNFISKYDYLIDKDLEKKNDFLAKEGFIRFEKKISRDLITNYYKFFNHHDDGINYNLLIDVFDFVLKEFSSYISGYLGGNYILCSVTFPITKKDSTLSSISDSWHTDNVGHKLNLHICIEGDGTIPTLFVKESHKKKYNPSILEDLRNIKKSFKNKYNVVSFGHRTGDCTIFDSNGLHRGNYIQSDSVRKLIFLDFMDRDKFLALSYKNNFFKDKSIKLPYRIQENSFKKNKIVSKDIYDKLIKFPFINENSFIIKDNSYYCFFL